MNFFVPEELESISVKSFLRRYCKVSARMLARLKRTEGGITSDGSPLRSTDILHGGQRITLKMPTDDTHITPENIPVKTSWENENVIVFDKPAGMYVHPVGGIQSGTLANAAAWYAQSRDEQYLFRPVNRLDRDTSGLVLCAKNAFSASYLSEHCQKTYIALCEGKITGSGTIDAPLRVKPGHSIQREVGDGGVRAVTHYEVLKNFGSEYTLLKLHLETGRTHQIRAHFSHICHPLAGDDMYGGSRSRFQRQCLHCAELVFTEPVSGCEITVESPVDFFTQI